MKIGTKLAICFIALAVIPLGAASIVYLRATSKFGVEMADRGKDLLAERINRDLRRAAELGAVTIGETRSRVAREVRFLASDVATRIAKDSEGASAAETENGFILDQENVPAADAEGMHRIDLQRLSMNVAPDASRDQVAGILNSLAGLNDVVRTIYLRNRGTIDLLTVTFENGLTITYPGNAASVNGDPREENWYLTTLEAQETAWFNAPDGDPGRISVATPVQRSDGHLVGAARATIRADALLARSLDATRLPPEARAYLFGVPKDDPALMPHEVAAFSPGGDGWTILPHPRPVSLDGDDAWLKVVSDIRTGVPGLEYLTLEGSRQVWAFGPVGSTMEAGYHIAVTFPVDLIESARAQVGDVVEASYRTQLRTALMFTLVAGLVAAGLAIFGAKTLTSPIRRLHEAAARLGQGDFTVRVAQPGGDEIGDLARGFNRMVPGLEEQLRVKRDLFAAQEIQQHLVPASPPDIDGFDIAGRTIYCDETGGDYQDYVPLAEGRYAVVVGDVTGHGVGAALMMAAARALIRANAAHHEAADDLMAAVNRQLAQDSTGGRSLTLFFMLLRGGSRDIDWISAGHESALVFDPGNGSFTVLEGEDIPLGVDAEWTFKSHRTTLPAGGVLVAFTDGIREARNGDDKEFGLDRLKDIVRQNGERSSAQLVEAVLSGLEAFRGQTAVADDVSVVVIRPS